MPLLASSNSIKAIRIRFERWPFIHYGNTSTRILMVDIVAAFQLLMGFPVREFPTIAILGGWHSGECSFHYAA